MLISLENRVTSNFFLMGFGKLGNGFGSALAIGAAVASMPDQAEAQDFNSYCAPLANGEVLESELTPQNMAYIFDENGQVIGTRADELTQYYGDGITEACDTGDIGAYVSKVGDRVLLEIYPPGQYPLGIDPETFREIQANYEVCVGINLAVVDVNQNGLIDADEDRGFYEFTETLCNDKLQSAMQHEGRMAELAARQDAAEARTDAAEARTASADARIAAADARIAAADAAMQAITDGLIAEARREVGL